jgi:predicted AAA+ superfamily ATPase
LKGEYSRILESKIADSLSGELPSLTRRSVRLPQVPGKALAVIGMRRAGKTCFLWQCLADRLASGAPRESLLYLNFEDERLGGMQATDLTSLTESYFRLHPEWRDQRRVVFFLDEIQVVPNWETYVRRLLDTEKIDVFLSGSSAKLLSSEVATSMRGRALDVLIHPYSFREALRHAGTEPNHSYAVISMLPCFGM